MIPICLITGFLGSGKTTLLKNFIWENRNRRIVYIVNEFTPVDVDGESIRSKTDDVISIPGGSIFCKCLVTRFIDLLKQIPERFSIDGQEIEGVVIEASGIADPRVVRQLLRETHLDKQFFVSQIIAIADPFTLPKLLLTLPNIRFQIEAADTILINKTDLASPDAVRQTEALIHEINPDTPCIRTTFCHCEIDLLNTEPSGRETAGTLENCSNPNFSRIYIPNPEISVEKLKSAVLPISDAIYRLKGFLQTDDCMVSVDFSGSGWQIEKAPKHIQNPGLAIIYRPEDQIKIQTIFTKQ
ncbi:MAG: GTP-binding protein [Candidatus Marinimicrobia bacterium]|nr:GTP-binding protein [Candidatus Neomarinimicrobiota bacterium]